MSDRTELEAMTVARLREEADALGIEVPSKAKKAELVDAILEADAAYVEAETVTTDLVQFGQLEQELAEKGTRLDALLAEYEGWTPDPLDDSEVKLAKDARATVNALCKEISSRRLEVKRAWMAPYTAYETACNAVEAKGKAFAAEMKQTIDNATANYQEAKLAKLEEHYEGYAGLLMDLVPFSKLAEGTKWYTKGMPMPACEAELEAKLDQLAADWQTLKGMGLEHQQEAERILFQTLDLGEATRHNARLVESDRKMAELKANMAPEPPAQTPVAPIPAPKPIPPQPAPQRAPHPPVKQEQATPAVMVIDSITHSQMVELGRMAGSIGVHGTFKRGTLAEVASRI